MDAARRATLGFAMLVLLWVLVYWWWEPSPRSISYDPLAQGPSAQRETSLSTGTAAPPIDPDQSRSVQSLPGQPPSARPIPAQPRPVQPAPTVTSPLTRPSEVSETQRGVVAPQFRDYTVRPGDTFQAIARRELGSAEHAAAISRANPLLDPTRIRAGQIIRIPVDPANIQGREIVTEAPRVAPASVEYTVRPGDTLSGISQRFYGSTAHADHILSANRATIPSARQLRAGQVITIPPPPTSDGASGPGVPREQE